MDGIGDRKLWHAQKFCVWPEISSGWLGMIRISLAPGHFWTELKIWAGRSRFCSKSQGLALWNKDSPPMILSFLPLHILGYVKSQQTLLVPSPSTARDMRHSLPMGTSGEQFLTSSTCYAENQTAQKDKLLQREVSPWLLGSEQNQPGMVSCLANIPFLHCTNLWSRTASTYLLRKPTWVNSPEKQNLAWLTVAKCKTFY